MMEEDIVAELRNGESEASRVALRCLGLMDDAVDELLVVDAVISFQEGLQTFHSCKKNRLLWVFHVLLDEILH